MGLSEYKHPYVTVDLLLYSVIGGKLCICLTKRDQEPFKDSYSLPGTFIREDESAEGAVERLLSSKIGINSQIYIEQLRTFSDINRDPRERVISIAYIGIIPDKDMITVPWMEWFEIGRSNVEDYKLVRCDGEKPEYSFISSNLGFDHDLMLDIGTERLRSKLDYTDILFKFLKDTTQFTAGMLREIYQSVTGQEINRGNFTKYQMTTYIEHGLIRKTGSISVGRGRPADTYEYIGGKKLWVRS